MDSYIFDNGVTGWDLVKLHQFLWTFLEYSDPKQVVFCGSLAIAYWAQKYGVKYPMHPINDVDVIAKSLDAISPKITREMWVGVYEPKKYLALFDRHIGLKVDVFTREIYQDEIVEIDFDGLVVQIAGLGEQIAKAIYDCYQVYRQPVDPKHFRHVELMLGFADEADEAQVKRSWDRHFGKETEISWKIAWESAKLLAQKLPANLVEGHFKKARTLPKKIGMAARGVSYTLKLRLTNASHW